MPSNWARPSIIRRLIVTLYCIHPHLLHGVVRIDGAWNIGKVIYERQPSQSMFDIAYGSEILLSLLLPSERHIATWKLHFTAYIHLEFMAIHTTNAQTSNEFRLIKFIQVSVSESLWMLSFKLLWFQYVPSFNAQFQLHQQSWLQTQYCATLGWAC